MTDETEDGVNIWLVYCDLFAGILIVFAVFYGLQLDQERAAKKELQRAQNKAVAILDQVANRINARYKEPDRKVISDGTQLVLPSDITFQSAKYTIRPEAKAWLLEIGGEIEKALDELGSDRRSITIEIRGHTDAHPLGGWEPIPTNWELSSRRATEIVRLFQANGLLDPTKFKVVAVGAAEFDQYEKNFDNGTLKQSDELESLRKIQIRIVPNYEDLLKTISAKPPAQLQGAR
ncbi:MAG TPA: OmpA family protein [Pyrinomonadaceae bacterium]|nr:OmpA family protein [Pyrinomonadaceae bacterium]